jgi:hypothetical protein
MSFLPKVLKKFECAYTKVSVFCNLELYNLLNSFGRYGDT